MIAQPPIKVRAYQVNCAGCHERRVFVTVEALAAWSQSHKCWERKADG